MRSAAHPVKLEEVQWIERWYTQEADDGEASQVSHGQADLSCADALAELVYIHLECQGRRDQHLHKIASIAFEL